jgi:hypothetical protein
MATAASTSTIKEITGISINRISLFRILLAMQLIFFAGL